MSATAARQPRSLAAEFLRHGSSAVLVAGVAAYASVCLLGIAAPRPLFVIAGGLLFYFSEYGTHRFLFHARPSRIAWLRAKQHRLHYDHHTDPGRLDLLFLPLWYVVPNMVASGAVAWLLLRDAGAVCALLAGAALALLHYEWVHFVAHIPYRPRTPWGRWMKKYHLWHHFKNEQMWFGVSNPAMDLLARTYAHPDAVGRSATARQLYPARARDPRP